MGLIPKRTSASQPQPDVPSIPDDIGELKKRCEELELENAVMKEMLGVLKAGPPTSTADLSNIEKTLIADSLRKRFGLSALLCLVKPDFRYHPQPANKKLSNTDGQLDAGGCHQA